MNECQLQDLKDDYDWQQAFEVSGSNCSVSDVKEIIAISDGENDGESWIGIFKLNNDMFVFICAWCDYTGWDCQSGGNSYEHLSKDDLIKLHVTVEDRQRLGLL